MSTPYMGLDLPVVSTTVGPDYAEQINASIETVDAHDHSSGKGIQVTPSGMNINADLTVNSNNVTDARSVRMVSNSGPIADATDVRAVYAAGNELYYNDGNGTPVQITADGALNASSIGGIGGDYSTSTASVAYSSSSKTFSFEQNTNQAANIDVGNVIVRQPGVTLAKGITLQSPSGLASDLSMTLPNAYPASTLPLVMGSSGSISAVDNLSITALTLSGALTAASIAAVSGTISGTLTMDSTDPGADLILAGSNPTTSTGLSNKLTPKNVPKAWGYIKTGASRTILESYNVSSISLGSGGSLRVNFGTILGSGNYAVLLTSMQPLLSNQQYSADATFSYFDVYLYATSLGAYRDLATYETYFSFVVFGKQGT